MDAAERACHAAGSEGRPSHQVRVLEALGNFIARLKGLECALQASSLALCLTQPQQQFASLELACFRKACQSFERGTIKTRGFVVGQLRTRSGGAAPRKLDRLERGVGGQRLMIVISEQSKSGFQV